MGSTLSSTMRGSTESGAAAATLSGVSIENLNTLMRHAARRRPGSTRNSFAAGHTMRNLILRVSLDVQRPASPRICRTALRSPDSASDSFIQGSIPRPGPAPSLIVSMAASLDWRANRDSEVEGAPALRSAAGLCRFGSNVERGRWLEGNSNVAPLAWPERRESESAPQPRGVCARHRAGLPVRGLIPRSVRFGSISRKSATDGATLNCFQ